MTTWPNAAPYGEYLPAPFDITSGNSFRNTAMPTDLLTIDVYHPVTLPLMTTFSTSTDLSTCIVCPYVQEGCSRSGGTTTCSPTGRAFLAQAGSATITQADQNAASGTFAATASNLRLVEWDVGTDTPVAGGACYEIGSAAFNVTWPGGSATSQQIAAIRAATPGSGLSLPVAGATVTYVRPAIGTDPAGFFVQAEQAGPAVFVAVDPTTLSPVPVVGDQVSFTATTVASVASMRHVQAISGYSRTSGGTITGLVQNLSSATDLVSSLDDYESEVLALTAGIDGGFSGSGAGHQQAFISTAGLPQSALRLRVTDSLVSTLDLEQGCVVTVNNTPMWRFNATAQVSAWAAPDVTVQSCPAPVVVSASAPSLTSVQVVFSRQIAPASLLANGSQFTIAGLTVTAASLSGATVTLTTSSQSAGSPYTVTAASSLTDTRGSALGMPNSATFSGFVQPAVVRINEVNANITGGCDLIELRVVQGGSMAGFVVQERVGGAGELSFAFPAGFSVAMNDFIVVHMNSGSATCNPGGASSEVTTKTDQPAATFAGNYDTAWDFWSTDTGLTSTDNVFTLYDPSNVIVDAVFVSDSPTATSTASATEQQAAVVGTANQWSPAMTSYIDAVFRMNAVDDLNATGTAAAGNSIQRLDNTDDNNVADWTSGAGAASTWGALNSGQTAF